MPTDHVKIELRSLSFQYDDKPVLENLSFQWDQKRIALLGRNGSGKSTLARLMAGLIAPSSGSISIDGINLFEDRKSALKTVGIVFQNPDHQIIFPQVIEELKFGFSQLGDENAEARALDVLKRYGREDWKNRLVSDLSQGQRHFLALISILEMNPKVLILDEAFTGLDVPTVMRLEAALAAFEGMVVHITHDVNLVDDYHHALWLEAGGVVHEGAPNAVIAKYIEAMQNLGKDDAHTGF